jgi:myosin-15
MAQVPSEVSNLFRKTEGWGSPHTERHVVKVPEVIPSLHLGLSLPYDINSFPFSKYVTLYLKDRHMGITKDAITSPFLPKSSIQDHHESLDIFRLILLYMNDPNLGEERRRIVADFVLQNGLTNEHMRDEILVQLCNQTMGSSKGRKSGDPDTAWTLLANCLGCFAPSPKLTNYFLKYVSDNTSSGFSAICQHKLLQGMSMETKIPRSYPPCLLEWTANKVKACMSLQGIFADGHKIYGHIESWTTGEEFASHLLQSRSVDVRGLIIFVENKDT